MSKDTEQAPGVMLDHSERRDGPALIALRGEDTPGNEFRLGTREYDWHHHLRGQVFCVESGLVHVRTVHGSWLLPPNRAGWIPSHEAHQVSISGAMSGWTVLITPEAARDLPDQPCVIGISEVMSALVRRAVPLLKAGGVLVYSTCSLEPEENTQVVENVLREFPELELDRSVSVRPQFDGIDGAFAARFYKR